MSNLDSHARSHSRAIGGEFRSRIRSAWRDFGLGGQCYCRQDRGAYRCVVVVHHGAAFDASGCDHDTASRFVEACRDWPTRQRLPQESFLFLLEDWDRRYRKFPLERCDLDRLVLQAQIDADRLPTEQWDETVGDEWEAVCGNGDRIEMWDIRVERNGRLYRVREGGWTSVHLNASYFDEVTYVGARRGAMLYAGFSA